MTVVSRHPALSDSTVQTRLAKRLVQKQRIQRKQVTKSVTELTVGDPVWIFVILLWSESIVINQFVHWLTFTRAVIWIAYS